MSEPRTVLEHLIDAREALVLEANRLTSAISDLDSAIATVEGKGELAATSDSRHDAPTAAQPVAPAAHTGLSSPRAATGRKAAPRTAAPRRGGRRSAAKTRAEPSKSIRVHVLEMLAAEDREFGLAEIIDRIHTEGIQAHDDAVRSITIKLMKDGKVERVGRGQYKLVRSSLAARAAAAPTPERDVEPAGGAPQDASANYTPPLNLGQSWDGAN